MVLRQTEFYKSLIKYSFGPDLLHKPQLRYNNIFKCLAESAPQFPEVCAYEAKQICYGIIPKFIYNPDTILLEAGENQFFGLILDPGWPIVQKTINDESLFDALLDGAGELRKFG